MVASVLSWPAVKVMDELRSAPSLGAIVKMKVDMSPSRPDDLRVTHVSAGFAVATRLDFIVMVISPPASPIFSGVMLSTLRYASVGSGVGMGAGTGASSEHAHKEPAASSAANMFRAMC